MSERNHGEGDNIVGLPTEFRFDESQVRAVMHDGEPWFIAKDVCDILDIADPRMALSRLDEDEKDTTSVGTTSDPREMLTVNEPGIYSLVFTSRKPEAKRFRKWVTSEVLPEIRKTGGYRRPETQFAGLSGERVEYERWLLERALLDAKLIALGMQSIGVHYERMVTDDPDFGAARADTNFADYHRELRANVHRSIDTYVAPNQAPSSTVARNLSNPQANRILALAPEPLSPSACRLTPALKRTSAGEAPLAGAAISRSRRWPRNFPLQRDRGFRP
jgi:prophage antirepressor-like protein